MEILNAEEYSKRCNSYTELYIEGAETNYIIVGKYIKKVIKKYKKLRNNEKYVYRQDKINKVFSFFSFLKIQHENSYVQFPLLPWQCFFLSFVFGFYHKSDIEKRLIREAVLFIGRKNGKTALSAAIQLYGMLGDGVMVPQSLLLANTSQQASIALNFAKDTVVHSPAMNKRLQGQRSRIIFKDRNKQGFCQVFSTVDPARLEGASPSMCICDEIHGWENGNIYNAIKTGIGARKNPLILLITTAGSKNLGFCKEYIDYHKSVLDEKIEDESSLALIYQPDPEDDLKDTNNWIKANPSLTFINSLDDLISKFKKAAFSYADKFAFITKHLNVFYDAPHVWIPEEYLLPLFDNSFEEEWLHGRNAFIGMDLSKNTDLSSIVLFIPGDKEKNEPGYAIPYFWMANREGNIIRPNGLDLSNWIFDGYINKCVSKTIDLDEIYNKIIELSSKFNIVSIQYDPYNAPVLISRLEDYGLICERFPQNASKFNAPLKMLEEMVYNKTLKMLNPALLWNFSNVSLYIDTNANIKIIKNKQNDSVDGCVALAMALGGWAINTYGEELMGLNQYNEFYKKKDK